MVRLRVEARYRIALPEDVIQTLRLEPGHFVEVRFPEIPKPERGLGTANQWQQLANQRLEDAEVLLASRKRRYNGAVYLSGYAIECILKATICRLKNLTLLPEEYKTHDLNDLLGASGLLLPEALVLKFSRIRRWSVDLRYQTRAWSTQEAHQFLEQVKEVKEWIETEVSPR